MFEIIADRNQGYPCIPELEERDSAELTEPLCQFMLAAGENGYLCISEMEERDSAELTEPLCQFMFVAGENGYPVIASMPEVSPKLVPPFPDYMMMCFGETINGGLPWIRAIKAIEKVFFSSLYFEDKQVQRIYFEGQDLTAAYCNGCKVFDKHYDRMKIV